MLKSWKNKKLLFKWSISYLILLCLTIIVNVMAYMIVEKKIVDMNNRNAVEVLKHKKQAVDELKSSLLDISYGISQDPDIRNLALNTKEINSSNRVEFFNLMTKTKSYFGMDSYFKNIFIHFNKINYITSNQNSSSSGQYYDFYYSDKNMSKNEWYSVLSSNHFGDFVDFSSKGQEPGKGNMLFLYSLYGNERFNPYATIVTEVEYSDFFSDKMDDSSDRMFIIADENQNIVVADKNTDIEYANDFLKKNEVRKGITDYGDFVTVSVPSDDGEWSYINIITKKTFRKSINDSRMIIIICNILCVGILSWLVFKFSNSNYRPLKKIIDTLDGGEEDIKDGEFQYINSKISEILMENNYISQKKKKQDELLRDLFLLRWVSNSSLPKNKDEIFEELEIFFPYEHFMCVLFCVELNKDMFFDNKNDDTDMAYQLAKVVLTNILDEKLEKNCFKYYCDMDNTLCMIVNMSDSEFREIIYKAICDLQEVVLKNFNIKFTAGISESHENSDTVSQCYNEAKACVDFRFIDERKLIKYETVVHDEAEGYYYPYVQEERLIRMLKVCDIESSISLLDEIFDKNFTEREISAKQAKYLIYTLVATIEENFSLNKEIAEDIQKMAEAAEKGEITFQTVKKKIYNTVIGICNNHDNEKNSRIKDTVERIKDYINCNYPDPDLNVNTVAQKFNITSSYMSTIFKKNTQIGLQEYIVSVRMEHAKNILSITNYTIDKVAVMVGYVNSRSFSRAFSKYVGISPGKYKETNQNV